MTRYRTIVADPPWDYPGGFNGFGQRRQLPYGAMSLAQIEGLPVESLLEREGYVFLWTPNRYIPHGAAVLYAWGCSYRQTLIWHKGDGGLGLGGMFATNFEAIFVGQRIKAGTHAHGPRTHGRRLPTSVFNWPRQAIHSQKPDAFLDMVEQVSPGPYLELFARRNRLGWDTWGDEALGHVEVGGSA